MSNGKDSNVEVLQSPQSHWSSGSIVCFPPLGPALRAPGVQPTLTLELGIPLSAVLVHW
jgi:hypothetical protein